MRIHGKTVVGLRNPIAPALPEDREIDEGVFRYRMHLGAPDEGPPGHVHGGATALVLDQALESTHGTKTVAKGRTIGA